MRRRYLVPFAAVAVALASTPLSASAQGADPAQIGQFGELLLEPVGVDCTSAQQAEPRCKPAAMALATLANGKQLYWNGLEGMNQVRANVVAEYGDDALNGQSRVLDLNGPTWETPTPFDGGANPNGNDPDNEYLPGVPHNNQNKANDGDMFCTDLNFLADGRVIANGGTAYYQEPGIPGVPQPGVTELQGLKNTRIFDPATNTWIQTGKMQFGRWYPSTVTEPNGAQLTFSGVAKLIKPVYPARPQDSGFNERHVERFDPVSGTWTTLPNSANKSLPLYPRLHMLPNGKIYYDGAGQSFNPQGGAIDQATWNFASVFDPATNTWRDVGLPVLAGLPSGFRGSTFSVMMPLRPDAAGNYTQAEFLGAGGVVGPTPGSYFPNNTSTINTIDTAANDAFTSRPTAPLNTARWYGTGTMLSTGEVFVSSGGDRDHVISPGSEAPIFSTEIFNPVTQTWTRTADQTNGRTYHNTATLLADGRVLVGGHAPIGTGYGRPVDQLAPGLSRNFADPTFQIFSPPNLFWGPRPVITGVDPSVQNGQVLDVLVDDAAAISSIRMVRNTSITHVVDSDQRNVELRILGRDADSVQVQVPSNTVLPPGPYMLFAHRNSERGEVPSVSRQVFVNTALSPATERQLQQEAGAQAQQELTAPAPATNSGNGFGGGFGAGSSPLPALGAIVGFGALLLLERQLGGSRLPRTQRRS